MSKTCKPPGAPGIWSFARTVGTAAARVIAMRILCMSLGAWLTVGIFGIQVIIWVITDNELEDWCELCAFGSKRTAPAAYKSVKQQGDALVEACKAVGV